MKPDTMEEIDLDLDFDTNDDTETSEEILRKNFRVGRDGGVPCIQFKTNGGKGSGPQTVRLAELEDFADALEECIERGDGEQAEAGYIPAPIQLRRTFQIVENPGPKKGKGGKIIPAPFGGENWFQWNSNTGNGNESKGSKPAKIPLSQAPAFLALFRERIDQTIEKAREKGILPPAEEVVEHEDDDLGGIE